MDGIPEEVAWAISQFVHDVSQHYRVNNAFLYGSYAKGTHDDQSDVDIAIFSDRFQEKRTIEDNAFLFSLARRYKNVCIEPISFNTSELEADNPFVKEILRTGKEIVA